MENEMIKIKTIIVGVNHTNDEEFNYQIQELEALCEACDLDVVASLVQNMPTLNNATYLGSGKLEELKNVKDLYQASLVVFLEELSPVQLRNIKDVIDVDVMDRTMLILEIFKKRAKTKEAILQVEIANLKYMLPRLAGSYTNLSRLGGGGSGAGGARRGSGETKLEEDCRHIERRITKAEKELAEIVASRKNARKKRLANEMKTVAFVGYTNAGKSSSINTLIHMFQGDKKKEVFVKNMLFATLETATRRIKLPTNEEFIITDTVGFVSNLPHHLIESFKSTLEEVKEASLIVHVVDASSPYANLQIQTTNQVLTSLGVKDIPMVYLLNKYDLVKNDMFMPTIIGDQIRTSNLDQRGFDELITYIKDKLFDDVVKVKLLIPYDKGEIFNLLKEKSNVHAFSYHDDGIVVDTIVSKYLYNLYHQYEIQ